MPTLNEVQSEVSRQLKHHFGDRSPEDIKNMCMFGLVEEAGEVAGLMKRVIRGHLRDYARATPEHFVEEMGDVLWYLAACCELSGVTLEDIWKYNISKLKERYGE